MIKKTLNQNAKYAHELLKAIEPDFVFSDTPINRLNAVQNNNHSENQNKSELLLLLKDQINSIQNCNLKNNSKNLIFALLQWFAIEVSLNDLKGLVIGKPFFILLL